jgi:superfamily II DNA or RNA helicase
LTALSEASLNGEQLDAIQRISTRRSTVLVAPTGAGKTVICLTAIKRIIKAEKLTRIIVACPAKVVSVWPKEVKKWGHLKRLNVHALTGGPEGRALRLKTPGIHVFVISLNNLEWLLGQPHGCDGIIIDELSKAAGKQTRKLNTKRGGDCFKWRVGMTATPVSHDLQKLHPMCKVVDGGKSLGTNKHDYLNKYFYSDYMGYNWTLREGAEARILAKIKKLVHMVKDTKEDDLPALHQEIIEFDMPADTRKVYKQMKRDMVVGDVEAINAAVRDGKMRQLSSGFLYDEDKEANWLDNARRDAAVDWWLDNNKAPAVIFYEFVAQGDKLQCVFKKHMTTDVEEFLAGKKDILVAQISSLSHGVDGLQHRANIGLMYHPMWSRDSVEQAQGRLWRTGAPQEVTVTTLVCRNTLDDAVLARVEGRAEWMEMFKQHLGVN